MFKSPSHKLIAFFESSRNNWKQKHMEVKKEIKRYKNAIARLTKSKDKFKEESKMLQRKIKSLETELQILKKKNLLENDTPPSVNIEHFMEPLANHQYSSVQIYLHIKLILDSALSFRGAASASRLFFDILKIPVQTPSFSSIRFWILRLGYYKLIHQQKIATPYCLMLDHVILSDATKVLLVTAIELSKVPAPGEALTLKDLLPVAVIPVEKSTGEIVYQQLEEISSKIGMAPRGIISDHGPDLKKGERIYCEKHPETDSFYDITHKNACVLKKYLKDDPAWIQFCDNLTITRKKLQNTILSTYTPPSFKKKARYMNLEDTIVWAHRILSYSDSEVTNFTQDKKNLFDDKFDWIHSFSNDIGQWKEMLAIAKVTETLVRKYGVTVDTSKELALFPEMSPSRLKAQEMSADILTFITMESMKVKVGERIPGTTEIIESVFGKYKRIAKDQIKNGFTSLILVVSAMLSETTVEVVEKAMTTVRTLSIKEWSDEYLGETENTKRREFHKIADANLVAIC